MEDLFIDFLGESVRSVNPINQHVVGLDTEEKHFLVEGWHIVIGKANIFIYNPALVKNSTGIQSLLSLNGLSLRSVKFRDNEEKILLFNFGSDIDLIIDLSHEKYNGPEAIVLEIPGKPVVVI